MIKAIPVPEGTRKDVIVAIRRARQELIAGHVVCIFAEGAMTRTGNMLAFHRGLEKIVEGLDVPVIPVHLGGVWGSIFSFREGRFFWKWPAPDSLPRQRVLRAAARAAGHAPAGAAGGDGTGSAAAEKEIVPRDLLQLRFVRSAKKTLVAPGDGGHDRQGTDLRQGADRQPCSSRSGCERCSPRRQMIGIMLPASVGGALANIAVLMAGKVPGEPELHGGQGSGRRGDRAVPDPDDPDLPPSS